MKTDAGAFGDLEFDIDELPSERGWGGAREGAGRPKGGTKKAPEKVRFDDARAQNEAAKARRNQLAFEIESGNYVSRESVRQGTATIMAELTQGLRGVEDNLEREGVPVEVCQKVGEAISRALARVGDKLELMANNPMEEEDADDSGD